MADEGRCTKCELPIVDTKVSFEGNSYHPECLACDHCKKPISGGSIYKIDGQIIDDECYRDHYADDDDDSVEGSICNKCEGPILDSKLNFEGKSYHVKCFVCDKCKKQITGGSVYKVDGQIIDQECYKKHYADNKWEEDSICNKCETPISDCLVTFEGKSYHSKCLVCDKCKKPISGGSIYKIDGEAIDEECYKKHYAKICAVCEQELTSAGVTYGDHHYHSECFRCYKCDKTLAGKKFHTVEEGRVCVECHASKCAVCQKLLIHPEKEKYVKYGGELYHAKCFCCRKCKKTLSGKKFYNLDDGKICVKCYDEEYDDDEYE